MLFLFVLIFNNLVAQKENTLTIYLDPVQILGMYNTSIDIGGIYQFNQSIGIDLGLAFILPVDSWGSSEEQGTGRKNGKGFEISFCPRYTHKSFFLGISNTFTFHNYDSYRLVSQLNPDLINYTVNQRIISSYLTIGGIVNEAIHPVFSDFSIGIGIRFINIENNSLIPITEYSSTYRLSEYLERESIGWHQLLGIKLSYKIGISFRK